MSGSQQGYADRGIHRLQRKGQTDKKETPQDRLVLWNPQEERMPIIKVLSVENITDGSSKIRTLKYIPSVFSHIDIIGVFAIAALVE